MEASHKKHRPPIKAGKDAEEEEYLFIPDVCLAETCFLPLISGVQHLVDLIVTVLNILQYINYPQTNSL